MTNTKQSFLMAIKLRNSIDVQYTFPLIPEYYFANSILDESGAASDGLLPLLIRFYWKFEIPSKQFDGKPPS